MKLSVRWILIIGLLAMNLYACTEGGSLKDLFRFGPEQLDSNDFHTHNVHEEFLLKLPKYLKRDSSMHPDAGLAYRNNRKEIGVILMEDVKIPVWFRLKQDSLYADSISLSMNYLHYHWNEIKKKQEVNIFPSDSVIIDKRIAAQGILETRVNDEEMVYLGTSIEGNEKIFLIICYTNKEKFPKFELTFKQIINSFQLLETIEENE